MYLRPLEEIKQEDEEVKLVEGVSSYDNLLKNTLGRDFDVDYNMAALRTIDGYLMDKA